MSLARQFHERRQAARARMEAAARGIPQIDELGNEARPKWPAVEADEPIDADTHARHQAQKNPVQADLDWFCIQETRRQAVDAIPPAIRQRRYHDARMTRAARASSRRYTSREIIEGVAAIFDMPVDLMQSKRRYKDIVFPRQVAMYVLACRGRSYPEVGRILGKDHSTVIHAVRCLADKMDGEDGEKAREACRYFEVDVPMPSERQAA